MSRESAVDFLRDSLELHFTQDQKMQFIGLFLQAKNLETENLIDAYDSGIEDDYLVKSGEKTVHKSGREYYQQTYLFQ